MNIWNREIQKIIVKYYVKKKVTGFKKIPKNGANEYLYLLKDSPILSQVILKKWFTVDSSSKRKKDHLNFFDIIEIVKNTEIYLLNIFSMMIYC